jgi:AraC family transcriptional regulator of adaptative response / DNA-3-methyladenine glycosylase II
MDLDVDACYRAFRTRDARFDGRLYSGCRTTGIFCRPICPVPTPRRENMSFYALEKAERWRPWRAYAAQHLWASEMLARRTA